MAGRRDLDDDSDNIPESRDRNGLLATDAVRDRSRDEASEKCSRGKQADDGTLADSAELSILTESIQEVLVSEETWYALVLMIVVRESPRLTRNLSRLVSEHETSDGGDGAEEDRNNGDFLLARSGTAVEVSAIGSVASHSIRGSCVVCLSAGDFESPHLGHGHHPLLRSRIFEIGLLEDERMTRLWR